MTKQIAKKDVEMALIQMGRAMKTIVGAYSPNANHISISVVNGDIDVSACEYDGEKEVVVEKDILDAVEFQDGTIRINGEYIRPEGMLA
jgi:hypothetical protein